ncbi:MAG: fibronectin type III domain-containing protein [Coriobacteriia bacterium]|nr:fibronectin type III domain-containing protein [Coriobacteriia bacterium]
MPSKYTSSVYVASRGLCGWAEWSQSNTDTTSKVAARGVACMTNAWQYGAAVEIAIDQPPAGTKAQKKATGYLSSNPGSAWWDVCDTGSIDFTFTRTATAYNVEVWVRAYGETVSGYGAAFASAGSTVSTGWVLMATLPIPALAKPAAPTDCTATRSTDTSCAVKWANKATASNPYTNVLLERSVDGGSWTAYQTLAANVTTYTDTTAANKRYQYRVRAIWQGIYSACATSTVTYTTPSAHSACTNTRVSDTQNTVAWTLGAASSDSKTTYIERSVDGGTYAQITTVKGTVTSYADKATSANHSYSYRVRSGWGTLYSGYATSGVTYNTPSAPGKPTVARMDATKVRASFANTALTATATELQRSSNGTSWTAAQTQSGSAVVSIDDTPGGGTWYYRVRNTRGTLASAYSATSAAVVTLQPPAAPTLVSPASSAVISTAEASIAFQWTHNPLDGSAQTSAELQYSTNGGTSYTTVSVSGSTNKHTLTNSFTVNATVTWRVRTKGADAAFGAYSSTRTFKVYQAPSVAITSPGTTPITDLPIGITWTYTDLSGTQQQATVELLSVAGKALFSRTLQGTATTFQLASGDFLPDNHTAYTLRVTVRSTTSLVAQTQMGISTDYTEPAEAEPGYAIDAQRAAVELSVFEGDEPEVPPTVSMGIMRRRSDGSLLVLVDKVPSGTAVTDVYPPLDERLTYLFIAYAASGVASIVEVELTIPSKMTAFLNFGQGYGEVAKVALDLNWDRQLAHTRELFTTAGRTPEDRYPVADYGSGLSLTGSIKGTAVRDGDAFDGLISYNLITDMDAASEWTGPVIVRLPHERPFAADVAISQSFTGRHLSEVNVDFERVRAHGLAL